ncbi:hypothetical protein M1247_27390 [Mycobacterium sp. 21AC1]|uniref:hypothetical protein n=1 Tax=[Mycobacterium] appelbergii TaxID=2939269 RepID=UPI002939302C|nr:hypothetical protein [Mycobacterium sp. 21AC1]MDV3128658.1 hypothetical protein [Mycobacterium sp. 21AC1]
MTSKVLRGFGSGAILLSLLTTGCAEPPAGYTDLHEDYTTKPNGDHPPTFDSGQEAVLTYTPNEMAIPTISGGRSVITYRGDGKGAGYASGQLNVTGAYIEADWDFSSSGTTESGVLALGLYASPLPPGDLGSSRVPDSPAHVVFSNDHFEYGVWKNDNLTVIANVAYGTTFTTETQHVAVFVRKDLGQAWVLAPTGALYGPFSHQSISDTEAPYAAAEQFYDNADTDRRVEIQKWRATGEHIDIP